MESDKAYLERLHDLEKKRRRLLKGKGDGRGVGYMKRVQKGKTKVIAHSGGRELNDSGEEEEEIISSTTDSVEAKSKKHKKGKNPPQLEEGCGRVRELNDSGEEDISTTDSVGCKSKKKRKRKKPQVEEGVIHYKIYKISRRCNLDRIYQIKKNLEKENLELFEQSCFGHLLKINSNDLIFQGQVFAQLMMHVDMDASNKERQLVFNIGTSQIRFSAKEFALITGLRLGTSEAAATTSEPSSIHKNVLGGKRRTTLKEFEEAFLRVSREHEGRGELTLKLALLYFLFGVLLPKHPHTDKIEVQYLHLAEDLGKFNAFSWGRVSYEFLVSSVLSTRSCMDSLESVTSKKGRRKDARPDIHGFIFALQIWGYEVMPSLAEYCAEKIINSLTVQPRIFRWTNLKRLIRFNNLKKFFAPGDGSDGVDLVLDGIKGEVEELSPQPKKARVVSNKDEKCSTSSGANEDVIIIISDDEDDGVASDDDSCSTAFMDNYVSSLVQK